MKKNTTIALGILTIISISLIVVFAQFRLPDPLPADASADQFSAQRAINHLEPLVVEPHPAGSPELAAVREDLVTQLEELGLEVEIQSTTGSLARYQVAGQVDNIIASLEGTGSTGALLLMAHYDSVPQGPGAGDNGAHGLGVVTTAELLAINILRQIVRERTPIISSVLPTIADMRTGAYPPGGIESGILIKARAQLARSTMYPAVATAA